MDEIAATCPLDDRVPERKVFVGFSPRHSRTRCGELARRRGSPTTTRTTSDTAMPRSRSRRVPITNIAAQVGHSNKSLTLDTYSHVLLDD
jgi:hypothetical protein